MSWSISAKGDKEAVRASVGEQLDACARNYASQNLLEGADVYAVRGSVMSILDTIAPSTETDVVITAYGSRGDGSYLSVHVDVSLVKKEAPAASEAPTQPETPAPASGATAP